MSTKPGQVQVNGRNRCVAFVVPERGRQPKVADLVAAVSGSMAAFKVPARILFLDELPVTRSANATKIQRGKLREMALERLAKGKTGL